MTPISRFSNRFCKYLSNLVGEDYFSLAKIAISYRILYAFYISSDEEIELYNVDRRFPYIVSIDKDNVKPLTTEEIRKFLVRGLIAMERVKTETE